MENSQISWTDHTFNPWIGCTKVSDGCKHCYAETQNNFRKWVDEWGSKGTRKRTSESYWSKPIKKWNKDTWRECVSCGWRGSIKNELPIGFLCPKCWSSTKETRQRVFCASLADVFEDRPELEQWREELLLLIDRTPNLDWLLLTKRPENVNRMIEKIISAYPVSYTLEVMSHMWIGTSVENQRQADKRIPELLNIEASKHFLSIEPLLGAVDLHFPKRPNPNNDLWVIVGGESGKDARPMHPDWARSLRDQCKSAGAPFFFKQMSSRKEIPQDLFIREFPK